MLAPMILREFQPQLIQSGMNVNEIGQKVYFLVSAIAKTCGFFEIDDRCHNAFEFGKCVSLIAQPFLNEFAQFNK